MKRYKISIIVFTLTVLSNLNYADNNLTKSKENSLEQLLKIDKEEEKLPFLLPTSEQVQSSSISKILTVEEIKKRLEEIEKKSIQEEIELEAFEDKVKKYQKKIEEIKKIDE